MFDLPRRVHEFSCMCCGERFWTTQGEATALHEVTEPSAGSEPASLLAFPLSAHHN